MSTDPLEWRNRAPGDLDDEFPPARTLPVEPAVQRSARAFGPWAACSLGERRAALESAREALRGEAEPLARLVARETGKPLREARLELGAVLAKFDLTFADGDRYLADEEVLDGPNAACVRRCPRGPAAVIAPFNFPIHLGHGAAVAYLLAGNTVLFKPSPMAVHTGAAYAALMQAALPPGVFEFVPGWAETGRELCRHPAVRSVCFTGSIPAGTALARELAADYSKSLALELGGKNSVLVWADADLDAAATAVADAVCLTAGQRCNATSRVLVHRDVAEDFIRLLLVALEAFVPGDPLHEETRMGPVINAAAVERYREVTSVAAGDWIRAGVVPESVGGKRGHFVLPAVLRAEDPVALDGSLLATRETFLPVLVVETFREVDQALDRHGAWPFGLTASVFSRERDVFERFGRGLAVGNLYWNLPTTFSPSTLPFGGWGTSGNGRPGGRGFIRYATDEQSIQWKA